MSDEVRTDSHPLEARSTPAHAFGIWGSIALLLILLSVAAGYAWHEHALVSRLATQNSDAMSLLEATRGQVADLTTRLNDLTAQPKPHPVQTQAMSRPLAAARRLPNHHRAYDPRWKEIEDQLASQQKQIDASRGELASTRTELQGSIARTHDELVVLEKKGERSYYEFDVDKNGPFQRKGPVAIRLRKANTKHQYADLELMVDDFKLSQKHVNLDQPVIFYAADSKQPAELVINTIGKDRIHGYVSEPRFKSGDLEAAGSPSGNTAASSSSQPRQRLQPPAN
jgi:hypothetical protein